MDKRKTQKYEQITREVRQKRKAEESLIESTPGATELMEKASLKEAAAVFTIEGIQTFMDVFDKTINKKLSEALSTKLEQAVERIIERKMVDIIEGATDGLNRYIAMMTEPQPVQQPVQHMQQVAITSNIEEKVTPYKKTAKAPANAKRLVLGLTDIKKHEHILANILAQQNGVFSPGSIMVAFTQQTGKYWSHATKVLQFMMKLGYNIEKVGRAQYVYNMSQGENSRGGN